MDLESYMESHAAKMIHIAIDKQYNFRVKEILNILNCFFKEEKIKEKCLMFSDVFWKKGYLKDILLMKYKKSIDSFLQEECSQEIKCDSVSCEVIVKGQGASFSFSAIRALDNTITCYMVQMCDYKRVTDSQFDKRFIAFIKNAIGSNLIMKIN